jgi:serine protease Do
VRIQPLTPDLAKEFKLPADTGALVGDVTPKTPAAEAGLKEGDVIVEFNGKKVTDDRHLRLMAAQTLPGTRVTLKALRDGKEQTFTVKLGELPSEVLAKAGRSGGRSPSAKGDPLDGVEVTDLDASARRQLNIPNQVRGGALVVNVDPGSPAAAAGLQPGDVILEINRKPVASADEAIELSQQVKDERVLLRVWSRGGSHYILVKAGKRH